MSNAIPRLWTFGLVAVMAILALLLLLVGVVEHRRKTLHSYSAAGQVVMLLGLSDLALTTEARYTRHPAASDGVVPFMDHPGALEHFPSGSFFRPVQR